MKARTLALLACLTLAAPGAAAARSFEIGFFDGVYFADQATRTAWYDRTVAAGAGVVRLDPRWPTIAPATRPPGFDPADPGDPAYRWASADAAVRDAAARHLDIVFGINGAPSWAEGAHRPRSAAPGSWRPDPAQVAAFARAAATRYSGAYPDPLDPSRPLPRIRNWQIWNEPNLSQYLTPQWTGSRGHYRAAAPSHYRAMLNAAYDAIKAVHGDDVVATAGTAPYGDLRPGGNRISPVTFVRDVLRKPTRFDALAHHPYGVRGPTSHALNAADVAVPDIGKLSRVVRAAQRSGTVTRGRKRLWVTEISWDSRPPDPQGVPAARHARWVAQSLYVLWRQGVDLVTWFQVRDEDASAGYPVTYQSGVYFNDGRPKRALRAFQFPFVVDGRRAWGKAPAAGAVAVQRRVGARWRTVARPRTGAGNVFVVRLRRAPSGRYRAVEGSEASLEWRVG